LYFFYGQGCPYCARAEIFLKDLKRQYPTLGVVSFEVYNHRENWKLYSALARVYQIKVEAVPGFFINDKVFVGYDEFVASQIKSEILHCLNQKCLSPREKLMVLQQSSPSQNLEKKSSQIIVGWLVVVFLAFILIFGLLKLIKKRK